MDPELLQCMEGESKAIVHYRIANELCIAAQCAPSLNVMDAEGTAVSEKAREKEEKKKRIE